MVIQISPGGGQLTDPPQPPPGSPGAPSSGPSIVLGQGTTITQGPQGGAPLTVSEGLPEPEPTLSFVPNPGYQPQPQDEGPVWSLVEPLPEGAVPPPTPAPPSQPGGAPPLGPEFDALLEGLVPGTTPPIVPPGPETAAAPPPLPEEIVLTPDDEGVWSEMPYERAEQPHISPQAPGRARWLWWGLGAAALAGLIYYVTRPAAARRGRRR